MGNNIKDYNHREIVVIAALRDHRTVMQGWFLLGLKG